MDRFKICKGRLFVTASIATSCVASYGHLDYLRAVLASQGGPSAASPAITIRSPHLIQLAVEPDLECQRKIGWSCTEANHSKNRIRSSYSPINRSASYSAWPGNFFAISFTWATALPYAKHSAYVRRRRILSARTTSSMGRPVRIIRLAGLKWYRFRNSR